MTSRKVLVFLVSFLAASAASAQTCVDCHKVVTPNIVSDWLLSKHSPSEVECSV